MSIHVVIHGHFYQPPRENPWTGAIERQESAAPLHDWNVRVAEECYLPNTAARVLDDHGRILDIVSNYDQMSFNFGPTLLSWASDAAPALLRALAAADHASLAQRGHGNAIAQAYNHMILPLATLRDRRTQIRWGIREFQHRFRRFPEAMWLPETAVDDQTLSLLVDAGMRYVILSPAQAARWRPLGASSWNTAGETELDPRRPYRWIQRDAKGHRQEERGIDVCFYDAPLSRGVSFQHYLRDAERLAHRIGEAGAGGADPLVLIATDGESYGHHEKFGEMCLARLFAREAARHGLHVTNLAAYLADHPPAWEVELLPESAWSCAHGVGRWREDCGCSAGGGPGWNQAWRRPLRLGLDRLRDALAAIFQDEAGALLRNPWDARDDYIDLILHQAPEARKTFLDRHQVRPLNDLERARALRLLEMQHHAMLMFTSCGWFFSDISGIETVQNLRYAARAIDLAAPFAHVDLEAILVEELAKAQSNVEDHKHGRHIWERQVRPSRVGVEEAAARLLAEGVLGCGMGPQVRYRWALVPDPILQGDGITMAGIQATSEVTGEAVRLAGAGRQDGAFDLLVGIAAWPSDGGWSAFAEEARAALRPDGSRLKAWTGRFAARLLRLHDFLPDERQAMLSGLVARSDIGLAEDLARICTRALPAVEAMAQAGMPPPEWLRAMLTAHWSRCFAEKLARLDGSAEPAMYARLLHIRDRASALGLHLDLSETARGLGESLVRRLDAIADTPELEPWQSFLERMQMASRLGLHLPERALQDRMFTLLHSRLPRWMSHVKHVNDERYRTVSAILAVATRLNLRTEDIRGALARLEEPMVGDPTYWP